jgi:hypothetical protein
MVGSHSHPQDLPIIWKKIVDQTMPNSKDIEQI